MPGENGYNKSLTVTLAEDELGFCCMYTFLRETKRWSGHKVAEAMGISSKSIYYWRDKKSRGVVTCCPRCHLPQTQLELKKRASGTVYFVRSSVH